MDNTITLDASNYYSAAANTSFMSVSQFKDFAGSTAHPSCEEAALKKLTGEYVPAESTALLVGSYVDSYFEGTLDEFKNTHPQIFKKTGDKGLLKDYAQADIIIDRINRDALFSSYMSGAKQVIMTANMFGIDWKIKMDSYHKDDKIVDLKVMRDMNPVYSPSLRQKVDFIKWWGYDIQGAIYQKVVEINTGKKLPFYIACATKEYVPDIEIIQVDQDRLDETLEFVKNNIEHVINVKTGIIKPTRCEECAYCKSTKVLSAPTSLANFMQKQNIITENESNTSDNTPIGLFD